MNTTLPSSTEKKNVLTQAQIESMILGLNPRNGGIRESIIFPDSEFEINHIAERNGENGHIRSGIYRIMETHFDETGSNDILILVNLVFNKTNDLKKNPNYELLPNEEIAKLMNHLDFGFDGFPTIRTIAVQGYRLNDQMYSLSSKCLEHILNLARSYAENCINNEVNIYQHIQLKI
ncbi:TPA: hypothetical protein ACGIK9_003263 [Acinetobacter baumannii]|uniref:hypothetical protein n=1 Tax=Acinetobacter baumannii TaxID=470 RepID=UPI00338FF3DF